MLDKRQLHRRKELLSISDGAKKKKMLKTTQKNDGIAYHHHSTGHQIDFDNVQLITQEKNYWRRLMKQWR